MTGQGRGGRELEGGGGTEGTQLVPAQAGGQGQRVLGGEQRRHEGRVPHPAGATLQQRVTVLGLRTRNG